MKNIKNEIMMKNNQTIITGPKKQQGVVLIVALIMLLAITIIGVSVVKRSSMGTQVAGNSMYSMLVYQGAESGIARSMTGGAEKNIKMAAESSPSPYDISTQLPDEKVTSGRTMVSNGTVTSIGKFDCPIVSGMANSTSMKCYVYEVNVDTNLAATAANATHTEARASVSAAP